MSVEPSPHVGLGQVLRIAEFRVLWSAELVSVAGDQLARVGLSALVYARTGDAACAAGAYALTFLPALVGGVLLGRPADRHPRRTVMVACDTARAVLVAGMAVPGLPLPVLCGLLVAVVLLASPHAAAQGALLPEVVPGAALASALAVRQITNQTAQVGGFVLGGVLVAVLSPTAALALDAATFALSALLVSRGVAARPAPGRPDGGALPASSSWLADTQEGLRTVLVDPRRRLLAGAAWFTGILVVPEALAVPYAEQLGLGPTAAGLLMAADPAGSVLGAWAFIRFVPDRLRRSSLCPLAVGAAMPLLLCARAPGLVATVLLWACSGACATACLVQAQADFVRVTPAGTRGRAIGVTASGLIGVQGLAMLIGGFVAQAWGTRTAVAGCGVVAVGLAVALTGCDTRTSGLPHRRLGAHEVAQVGA